MMLRQIEARQEKMEIELKAFNTTEVKMRSKKFRTLRFAEKDTDVRYQHAQRNPSKSRHENMTIYNYHTKYLQVTCQNQDR